MEIQHVDGQQRGAVMLYSLSTCVWCKKTKNLLTEMNIAFDYLDVDLLDQENRAKIVEEVKKWNPDCSFPSLVIDQRQCIVGFDEKKIREALEK